MQREQIREIRQEGPYHEPVAKVGSGETGPSYVEGAERHPDRPHRVHPRLGRELPRAVLWGPHLLAAHGDPPEPPPRKGLEIPDRGERGSQGRLGDSGATFRRHLPTLEAISSLAPGDHGGNVDLPDTFVGNTIYLPVRVEGGLFFTGNCHVAQGQGVLSGVALEVSARVVVTFEVLKNREIAWPRI
jgi:hypothetical protein